MTIVVRRDVFVAVEGGQSTDCALCSVSDAGENVLSFRTGEACNQIGEQNGGFEDWYLLSLQ